VNGTVPDQPPADAGAAKIEAPSAAATSATLFIGCSPLDLTRETA